MLVAPRRPPLPAGPTPETLVERRPLHLPSRFQALVLGIDARQAGEASVRALLDDLGAPDEVLVERQILEWIIVPFVVPHLRDGTARRRGPPR